MKLIIHAGLHKTGTTSFQTACSRSRGRLAELGIHFPSPDSSDFPDSHFEIAELLKNEQPNLAANGIIDYSKNGGRSRMLLLSSENFSNSICTPNLWSRFIQSLAPHFENIAVCVVVREIRALVKSSIATKLKGASIPLPGHLEAREFAQSCVEKLRAFEELDRTTPTSTSYICYETLPWEWFPTHLLTAMLGEEFPLEILPNTRVNLSGAGLGKNPNYMLGACLRGCLGVSEKKNPFASSITERLQELLNYKNFPLIFRDAAAQETVESIFEDALDQIADTACAELVSDGRKHQSVWERFLFSQYPACPQRSGKP